MIEQVNLLMANLPIIAGAPNLADWVTAHVWPEFISSKVAMSRILKHGEDFKGSASEALSVYSVIRAYLQKFQMLGHHDLEFAMKAQSFLAICSLIDELRSTMGDGPIDPDSIHDKVVLHLTSFVAAYGEQGFTQTSLHVTLVTMRTSSQLPTQHICTRAAAQADQEICHANCQCWRMVRTDHLLRPNSGAPQSYARPR